MKKSVIAMVLVGGRGSRLAQITKHTAKPAVSFGGKFKLIDFVLSNLSNSNIDTCGIITQYEPHELMSYIGHGSTWDLDVNEGGISFLTPYANMDGQLWQEGTAHAIYQHFKYIEQHNPDYVVVLSGDHVYKMNYMDMINEHIKNNADITISAFSVSKNPQRFGILQTEKSGRVINFEEKPEFPKSNLASMGVYVFNKKILQECLSQNRENNFDFGHDIIPLALENGKSVYAYRFNGYFRDVGTVASLYRANMDLIDNPHYLKLHEYMDSPVYTKSSNLPPHHIANKCVINQSLISDGCLIYGDVYHSVLSSGTVVGHNAIVKNSVIHRDVQIGDNAFIDNAIVIEETKVPQNMILKFKKTTIVDQDVINEMRDDNE